MLRRFLIATHKEEEDEVYRVQSPYEVTGSCLTPLLSDATVLKAFDFLAVSITSFYVFEK
jgi:hypothetical protein